MKIEKNYLSAFNNLYNLGLTDEQLRLLVQYPNNSWTYESKIQRLLGYTIQLYDNLYLRKKEKIYKFGKSNHIKLLLPEEDDIETKYLDLNLGMYSNIRGVDSGTPQKYVFSLLFEDKLVAELKNIMFYNLSFKDYAKINFIISLDQFFHKNPSQNLKGNVYNSFEEFRKDYNEAFIKNRAFSKSIYSIHDLHSLKDKDYQKNLLGLKFLFKNPKITNSSNFISYIDESEYLNVITSVIDTGNTRVSLSLQNNVHYDITYRMNKPPQRTKTFNNDYYLTIFIANSSHPHYNYLDINRTFIDKGLKSSPENKLGTFIFTDIDTKRPSEETINKFMLDETPDTEFVSNEGIDLYKNKLKNFKAQKEQSKYSEKILKHKLNEKIDKFLHKKIPFKLNRVSFEPDKVVYEGQELKVTVIDEDGNETIKHWVLSEMAYIKRKLDYNRLNFSVLNFEYIIDIFSETFSSDFLSNDYNQLNLKVGNINIKRIKKITNKNNGNQQSLHYLNGHRIGKNDLKTCIEKAVNYDNLEEYNKFLQSISSCSTAIHNFIKAGLEIKCYDPINEETLELNIPVEREGRSNFLILNNKKIRIKDSNRAMKLNELNDISEIISKLLNPKIFEDLELEDLKVLIKEGKENYNRLIEKEIKFLKRTEKLFNIKPQYNIKLSNGINVKKGYIIKGNQKNYVIDAQNENKVFDYPQGNYLCMIDKSHTETGVDRLINRIYALHNDSLVSNRIVTIGV